MPKRKSPGYRCGQQHHNAKLTDHEVELIRSLHDEGMGYKLIAKKFEVSPRTVRGICNGRSRL